MAQTDKIKDVYDALVETLATITIANGYAIAIADVHRDYRPLADAPRQPYLCVINGTTRISTSASRLTLLTTEFQIYGYGSDSANHERDAARLLGAVRRCLEVNSLLGGSIYYLRETRAEMSWDLKEGWYAVRLDIECDYEHDRGVPTVAE